MCDSGGRKLQTNCLRAFVFNLEISRHCVRPDVQGMRLAGMAILQHPQLSCCPIELGLIVQNDCGAGDCRKGGESAFRRKVLVKMWHVIGEVELGAARIHNGQRLAMVVHLENAGDRSGCVARRQIDGDGSVADRDFHPVRGDDIALWLAGRIPVDRLLDHIPIVHHNTRTIARLEQKGAANLASVTVGNDDVLYPARTVVTGSPRFRG